MNMAPCARRFSCWVVLMVSATAPSMAGAASNAAPNLGDSARSAPAAAPFPTYRPGQARLFDPATLHVRTLTNGVRGIIKETRGTGLVSVQVWVRAGGRYESSTNSGVSHLIETLAMRASKNYPRSPQAGTGGGPTDAIEGLGGVATSQTSRDATFYSATVSALFLPAALRALADAVLRPNLADGDVDATKLEVQAELARREVDPVAAASNLAYELAFARHPYRRPANGTSASVENLTGTAVRSYYRTRYVGANISVVVVGDAQPGPTHTLIERLFAGANAARPVQPKIAAEPGPTAFKTASRRRFITATAIALGFGAPGIATPDDVVAMDVLLAHWREGRQAALRRILLGPEKSEQAAPTPSAPTAPGNEPAPDSSTEPSTNAPEPLALGFDVDFLTQRDPGLLIVSLLVEEANRNAAVNATLDQIALVRREGIDSATLARDKSALVQQYVRQGETVSGQAGALGFYDMIDSYKFAVSYLDRIARVTPDDIRRVAGKYLSNTTYVQAAIEPAPRPQNPQLGNDNTITAQAGFSFKS